MPSADAASVFAVMREHPDFSADVGDWHFRPYRELDTTKARLENLQYFSDVQVNGSPSGSGYRDVNVLVEEKKAK